jgi:diacylglycerol kinase (ATP)
VRAAAILHPYVEDSLLEQFRAPEVNIFRGNVLDRDDLPDVVLVFGGDGSVHRLLPALAYSSCPLLIVPTGSGNDFATALGLTSISDAVHSWQRFLSKRDNARTIDLGMLTAPQNGSVDQSSWQVYFSSVAGVGLDAATNEYASRMPRWLRRSGGYAIAAMRSLAAYRAPRISVRAKTTKGSFEVSSTALIAAFGNSPYFGNGMRILPEARVDDGLLDLCFVRNVSKLRVIREFPKLYSGRHTQLDVVEYAQAASIVIESESPMPVCADGEPVATTPVEARVAPGALKVIVPLD